MTSERRKQRRAASLKRRRHVREPERRFHIYCEGTKTEPAYFKALRSQFSRVQLEVIPVGGDPMQVASKAIEHRRRSRRDRQSSFEETDQVWAVFDRDRHTTHAAALDACRRAGVHVASSDPCFELWLALHFEPYDKPAHSVQIQRRLHHLFPSYNHDKAPGPDFSDLLEGLEDAETHARRQLRLRRDQGAPFGNPSTTVVCLIGTIREAQSQADGPGHEGTDVESQRI